MPANYTYTVDRSDPQKHDVRIIADGGAVAASVSIVWPQDRDQVNGRVQVGPYSVNEEFRAQALSYALLWIGLTLVQQAGYSKMKTGLAHGPLNDTMNGAGLTEGETVLDPMARNRPGGGYLEAHGHPPNMGIVWHCDDLAASITRCEAKMTAAGTTITPPAPTKGGKTALGGCCVLM